MTEGLLHTLVPGLVWLALWWGLAWALGATLAPRLWRRWRGLGAAARLRRVGGLLALPVLLAGLWTLLLYAPGLDGLLIVHHCHPGTPPGCGDHRPWPAPGVALAGLGLLGLVALVAGGRALRRRSRDRSRLLGRLAGPWSPGLGLPPPPGGYRWLDCELALAVTLGAWRPAVWVSRGLWGQLDEAERRLVLRHELHHARRRDPLRRQLLCWAARPMPQASRRLLLSEAELALEELADAAAVRGGGARRLALLLIRLARQPGGCGPGLGITGADLERRVRALMQPGADPGGADGALVWLAAGLVLLALPAPALLHHLIEALG